jgi:hypothetical protein
MPLLALLFVGCAENAGGTHAAAPIGYYQGGWPIDACSLDFPDDGTGYSIGDVLPQHAFITQTNETAHLHDWCDHVVYIEIGYTT